MAKKRGGTIEGSGRKRTAIDWKKVGNMLKCQCTTEGVAASLGISSDTLYRRCKEELEIDYTAFVQQNRMQGVETIRMKQYQVAMEGDKTMLIWLGKQLLGQKEKQDITTNDKDVNAGVSRVVFDFTGKESEIDDEREEDKVQ